MKDETCKTIARIAIGFGLGALVSLIIWSCGSNHSDVDMSINDPCTEEFAGCRQLTPREFEIWLYTIDCLKDTGVIPSNEQGILAPLIKEEEADTFFCGEVLAVGCAHIGINLLRIPQRHAENLDVFGIGEQLYTHEFIHLLLWLFTEDSDNFHENILYTMPELCLNPSNNLF